MAKEEIANEEELEKLRREHEREERIKEEELKEIEREKEKEKKKKEREKKLKLKRKLQKKKEKKERKLIQKMIGMPFRMLLEAALLTAFILFIIEFFGNGYPALEAALYSFYLFLIVFLGGGIIMTAIFYVISEKKEKELIEKMEMEKEQAKREEEAKKQEELEILESTISNGAGVEQRRLEEMRKFRNAQASELTGNKPDKAMNIDELEEFGPEIGLPDDFSISGGDIEPGEDVTFDESINLGVK